MDTNKLNETLSAGTERAEDILSNLKALWGTDCTRMIALAADLSTAMVLLHKLGEENLKLKLMLIPMEGLYAKVTVALLRSAIPEGRKFDEAMQAVNTLVKENFRLQNEVAALLKDLP